ncbi:hypothetical protein RMR21_006555 [Agrobacterium sp. rho-8.1]|nr:hypothetical protein [Agrobacterium sp. rho-8.1]
MGKASDPSRIGGRKKAASMLGGFGIGSAFADLAVFWTLERLGTFQKDPEILVFFPRFRYHGNKGCDEHDTDEGRQQG